MKKVWVALAAGSALGLTACSGLLSPGPEKVVTEACTDFERRRLVPPYDTEGDCMFVPKVMAAAGPVGLAVNTSGANQEGLFVDLTTGAASEIPLPENSREVQALVAPVDGEPMFLVTDRGALFEDVLNEDQNLLVTR